MIIGVPREIKNNENRVSATPHGVYELVQAGHTVLVERGAGRGSFINDEEYADVGGTLLDTADEVWAKADLIYKVKEPMGPELQMIRPGQIIFTYLHLAPDPDQIEALLTSDCIAIAYETVTAPDHSLPLLIPMSEIAGRMAIQVGANLLQSSNGGRGTLLCGVPGVLPGQVVIAGGGNVGCNAARVASGLGASVIVLDINPARLAAIDNMFHGRVSTLISNTMNLFKATANADLLVGAVLVPGAKTPKIVSEEMVKGMKKGSVIVDVAIDQGGCVATMDHTTTHDHPCFEKHGVLHYSVANMPGSVPRTSTYSLSNATLPYLLKIANLGLEKAFESDPGLKNGLNICRGKITWPAVEQAYKEWKAAR
ncbi:MAG: alanine dehydrogenase [Planctomycetia bacterium]|nr:alanine dehydrogenase [Planctomycetia bacterium]